MSEQNKAVVRRWLEEAFNQGKVQVLDKICADDYVEYDPAYPGGHLRRDGVKQAIPMYRSAFPDLRFVIEDMIAEGDKVAVYWTLTATNLGTFRGMPPTGKRAEAEGMTLVCLRKRQVHRGTFLLGYDWSPTGGRHRTAFRSRRASLVLPKLLPAAPWFR